MSYDYFLQAFEEQEAQEIATEKVLTVFAPYVTEKADSYVDLVFDADNRCTVYLSTAEPAVSGMMINRPCVGTAFAACLYQVMLTGNFVFFEPDGIQPLITAAATEGHMPADMITTLGKPALAWSLAEFIDLLDNNR